MPNFSSLEQFIKAGSAGAQQGLESAAAQKKAQLQQQLDIAKEQQIQNQNAAARDQFLKQLGGTDEVPQGEDLKKLLTGMSIQVGQGGSMGVTGRPDTSAFRQTALTDRQDRFDQTQASNYSKRLEKFNDFNDSLAQLNQATAKGGQGGILTNPDAHIKGTGMLASGASTKAIGLGELLSKVPGVGAAAQKAGVLPEEGATEQRKDLERFLINYQNMKAGVRGASSPAAQAQEAAAIGLIRSGDPHLVDKGVRSLAKSARQMVKTLKAGYSPRVRDMVHSQMGDPEEALANVYDDNAPTAPKKAASDFSKMSDEELQAIANGKSQ